jgi:hypothetical protein
MRDITLTKGDINNIIPGECFKMVRESIHLMNNNRPRGGAGHIVIVARYKHNNYMTVIDLADDKRREFFVNAKDLAEIN